MPVAAYRRWDRAGRPLSPAKPIEDFVARLKEAFPKAAKVHLFSWYADDAHYEDMPAEDHTPYSQTGWPEDSPEWWVFATDVMHRKDLGVDCKVLFKYWLAEARAGRMPWLKYMNWEGKQYRAQGFAGETKPFKKAWANSGHYDHVHLSARTDYRTVGLGDWSVTPDAASTVPDSEGDDDMSAQAEASIKHIEEMIQYNTSPWAAGALQAAQRIETAVASMTTLLNQLLEGGGGSGDNAPVIAALRAEGTQTRGAVGDLKDAIAAREVELTKLRLDLSNALKPPTD